MSRVTTSLRRVRAEGFTPKEFRTICWFALLALMIICVSGAAVRLTGSGLGCDDWPNCNNDKLVDLSNKHAAIEQINRLFTFLVCIAVALAAAAGWYRRPRRKDLLVLGFVLLAGVPAQGVVGAIVVWADLNPATVQLHFVLSMVLVWAAVMMLVRSGEPDGGARVAAVVPRVRRRVAWLVVWTWITVLAGTVVTGTGPHAGDDRARRFFGEVKEVEGKLVEGVDGHALQWASRIHGFIVWITVAVALSLLWQLRRLRHDRKVLDAPITAWIITAGVQGTVGYVQYAAGLPVGMVLVHVAGATTLMAVTAWLWCSTTRIVSPADALIADATAEADRA
ncbi:MAG: COX15/CtaA family protein [Ilumatobacteraceae bacterium]